MYFRKITVEYKPAIRVPENIDNMQRQNMKALILANR